MKFYCLDWRWAGGGGGGGISSLRFFNTEYPPQNSSSPFYATLFTLDLPLSSHTHRAWVFFTLPDSQPPLHARAVFLPEPWLVPGTLLRVQGTDVLAWSYFLGEVRGKPQVLMVKEEKKYIVWA